MNISTGYDKENKIAILIVNENQFNLQGAKEIFTLAVEHAARHSTFKVLVNLQQVNEIRISVTEEYWLARDYEKFAPLTEEHRLSFWFNAEKLGAKRGDFLEMVNRNYGVQIFKPSTTKEGSLEWLINQ